MNDDSTLHHIPQPEPTDPLHLIDEFRVEWESHDEQIEEWEEEAVQYWDEEEAHLTFEYLLGRAKRPGATVRHPQMFRRQVTAWEDWRP